MKESQALPEARKRQIDARVAAWKKKIRDEVIAEIMAKQIGKDGEVVDDRAEGQAVGKAKADKDEDSMKTPVKPRNQGLAKMLKIVEPEVSDEEITPKITRKSTVTDEEDEARRQYEESVANMRQATERIRRIKADKEERFKMKLEEQKIEERRKKGKKKMRKRDRCFKRLVKKERNQSRVRRTLI